MPACPHHPTGQICARCDPSASTCQPPPGWRPTARPALAPPLQLHAWFKGLGLIAAIPLALIALCLGGGLSVIILITFVYCLPLLIVLGLIGLAIKVAIDYGARRIADETAFRR